MAAGGKGNCKVLKAAMRGTKSRQAQRKAFGNFAKAGCLKKGKKAKKS